MTGIVSREDSRFVQLVIGVDTHQDQHVAVAIDHWGMRLAERHAPATTCGYGALERWSRSLGPVCAFGIEGTGSYGAGLTRYLTAKGYTVLRSIALTGQPATGRARATPPMRRWQPGQYLQVWPMPSPSQDKGEVEMIRMLKKAKDSAIKARTQAVN